MSDVRDRQSVSKCRGWEITLALLAADGRLPGAEDAEFWSFAGVTTWDELADEAARVLDGIVAMPGGTRALARRQDGGIDWLDRGPDNDKEWCYLLNRHQHWMPVLGMWLRTGEARWAAFLDAQAADWLAANPTPARLSAVGPWRALELARRLTHAWPLLLHAEPTPLRDETRAALLASIRDHGRLLRAEHRRDGNHMLGEITALIAIGCLWPEIPEADAWREYGLAQMLPQVADQVYPDGTHIELTTGYQLVSLRHFESAAALLRTAGHAVPEPLARGTEAMWEYVARCADPQLRSLPNNDSGQTDLRPHLLAAADRFGREDWRYIATDGRMGTPPADGPGAHFPWAGQVVHRGGWHGDALWGWFDAGPTGSSGHVHADELNLSVSAHGRPLLVDAGIYTYRHDVWRQYYNGSAGHNVVLVDGRGQYEAERTVYRPRVIDYTRTEAFTATIGRFRGRFAGLDGWTEHSRAVLYLHDWCWVVMDHVRGDRGRFLQPLWHFHPDCTVVADGAEVMTTDAGAGNLRIVPLGDIPWGVDLVRGAEDDDPGDYRGWMPDLVRDPGQRQIQGWFSHGYGHQEPATCAVYGAACPREVSWGWVLLPAAGAVPPVRVERAAFDGVCAQIGFSVGDRRVGLDLDLGVYGRERPRIEVAL